MLFQGYITGKKTNEIKFHVPIGSAKNPDLIDFHPYAPAVKYFQHDKYTCVYISL